MSPARAATWRGAGDEREAEALDAYSRTVVAVAERVLRSVASVEVTRRRGRGGNRPAGSGSAVVLSADGLLVTSAHVVGDAAGGTAELADGRRAEITVIGADRLSDLAVLRVAADGLVPAELGDADRLRVGQLVVAVGSPLGFAGSVSAGVVSALGRSLLGRTARTARLVEDVIQTDAALHPGSSGGALADSAGRVVGINTAVVGPFIGQGLGLAVPVNAATRAVVATLVRDGRVRRAYLGVAGGARRLTPAEAAATGRATGAEAVEITSVVAGGPAAAGGVQPGDVVVAVGREPVDRVGDLQRLMVGERIGRRSAVVVLRDGRPLDLTVVPSELEE
ncbi:MAG: trypsin-like peptidase domain-containing protein [Acidimicrobiales bacterium]|nr:trypsin-like peptidase domain-containing protein [Acidimicrobiales bacterium]